MAIITVATSDTITLQAIFKDKNGNNIDPDANAATFKAYLNDDLSVVATGTATRAGAGIYTFDWLVPADDSFGYVLEMKGLFNAEPQLKRLRVKAKFRP